MLRQHGAAVRQTPCFQWRDRPAVEQHLARGELPVAGQGAQERALAGAVGADDGEELARRQRSSEMSRIRPSPARTSTADGLQRAHMSLPRGAAGQQPEEERPADQRGQHADRQLGRRDHGAGERIGQHQEGAAEQRRGRQQGAMAGAQQQAHDVRRDQADEADDAGDRHAGADRERDLRHQAALQPLDVDADVAGLALAQRQRVEQMRRRQQRRHADGQHQQGRQRSPPRSRRRSRPSSRRSGCAAAGRRPRTPACRCRPRRAR